METHEIETDAEFDKNWILIEKSFAWKQVYKAMKALDWKWEIDKENGLHGIPTVKTLKYNAKKLLMEVWNDNNGEGYFISAGGFKAGRYDNFLILEFILESQQTDEMF
jgi:hypothetical protein